MESREFMTVLYDLIAKNTQYHPREKLDELIAENIEDYCVDTDNYYNAHIMFTCTNGKRYKLALIEMEGE